MLEPATSSKRDVEALCEMYMKESKNPWHLLSQKGTKIHPFELEFIRSSLPHNGKILDSAGGTGLYSSLALKDLDVQITVLDQSKKMLQTGKELFPKNTYVESSCYEIPFDDNTFDGVLLRAHLMYLNDLPCYFSELRRILKPGGKIVIVDRNRFDFVHFFVWLLRKQNDPFERPRDFVHLWKIRKLLAPNSAFKITKEFGFTFAIPNRSSVKNVFKRQIPLGIAQFKFKTCWPLKFISRWIFIAATLKDQQI